MGLASLKAMSVYSAQYHAMVHSPVSEQVTVSAEKPPGKGQQPEGFFHHLLDVINPLQHLPLVGTLYRAITGDHSTTTLTYDDVACNCRLTTKYLDT